MTFPLVASIRHIACSALPALLGIVNAAQAADRYEWNQLPSLPDPLGVAGPFAGVSHGALLVAGGANFPAGMPWEGGTKVWHDRVWVLERPEGPWRDGGKLPFPLGYGVSATWRDTMICAGGSDATRHHAEAFRLSWKDSALESQPLPPLPIPLASACGAMVGDTFIVACGAGEPGEKAATNRVFALDLSASAPSWSELPPLPGKPRLLATAAVHDGTFYVFGGAALDARPDGKMSRVYLREAWSYRAPGGWKPLADLPKPLVAAATPAPVVDGKILLLGGDDGSLVDFQPPEKHPDFPHSILIYDPASDRWTASKEIPAPRATVPCVEWRNRFVVPSGEVRPGVRSPEVWSLSLLHP